MLLSYQQLKTPTKNRKACYEYHYVKHHPNNDIQHAGTNEPNDGVAYQKNKILQFPAFLLSLQKVSIRTYTIPLL